MQQGRVRLKQAEHVTCTRQETWCLGDTRSPGMCSLQVRSSHRTAHMLSFHLLAQHAPEDGGQGVEAAPRGVGQRAQHALLQLHLWRLVGSQLCKSCEPAVHLVAQTQLGSRSAAQAKHLSKVYPAIAQAERCQIAWCGEGLSERRHPRKPPPSRWPAGWRPAPAAPRGLRPPGHGWPAAAPPPPV